MRQSAFRLCVALIPTFLVFTLLGLPSIKASGETINYRERDDFISKIVNYENSPYYPRHIRLFVQRTSGQYHQEHLQALFIPTEQHMLVFLRHFYLKCRKDEEFLSQSLPKEKHDALKILLKTLLGRPDALHENVNLSNKNITVLPRIMGAITNLKWLNLSFNKITCIEPLTHLTNLEILNLSMNGLTDIEPLRNLTQLMILNLSSNELIHIEPLGDLINLNQLQLASNNIEDFACLGGLTKLQYVSVFNNPSVDDSSKRAEVLKIFLYTTKVRITQNLNKFGTKDGQERTNSLGFSPPFSRFPQFL